MAIEFLIALASLTCAASCFVAGYAVRLQVESRRRELAETDDEALLPLVTTPRPELLPLTAADHLDATPKPFAEDEVRQPQSVMLVPERAPSPAPSLRVAPSPSEDPTATVPTPKSGPALSITSDEQLEATEPMASRAAASLPVLLERLMEESQSESAALYDDQGLVVGSIGPHAGASAGVWTSLLARAVADAQKCGIFDGDNQVVELRDAKLGRVRCKSIRWHHQRLLLTTVGARSAWSTASERAVLDAVGRLFPIALVMGGELPHVDSGPANAAMGLTH